jgi:RNA polymerase sigma-70 factor (ECF subfamily)
LEIRSAVTNVSVVDALKRMWHLDTTLALDPPRSQLSRAAPSSAAPAAGCSDPELVGRMARGDRTALAELYERHAPRLCALARQILGDAVEAEDLVHDVFLEAWRHASEYAEARASVWSWLALRTRSRAIDRRRAAPRQRTIGLADSHLELIGAAPDSSKDPGRGSERERLRQALASMSEAEREVLLLGYFQGLSASEIAERLGAPLGTVKSRTRSALNRLRAFFSAGESAS